MQELAGAAEVWADPGVLLGVREKEVSLLAVELRESGRDPDQDLLDAAEATAPETGIYADAHGRASLEGWGYASPNGAGEPRRRLLERKEGDRHGRRGVPWPTDRRDARRPRRRGEDDSPADHDLRDRAACFEALEGTQEVFHLAANVGGIGYNRRNPGPLAHDNLAMGLTSSTTSRELGVEKLVAACSVCAYPKFTAVPFMEDDIWEGYPEESNAPYGLAKKMLLVLSDSYRRQYGLDRCAPVMANLDGPGAESTSRTPT